MAKQYLVDSCEFSPAGSSKPLTIEESVVGGSKMTKAKGMLGFWDVVNGNNRKYTKAVWEKNFKPDSLLTQRLKANKGLGLLEHPSDGKVDLQSPISHIVTAAQLNEDGSITGEITFVDTAEGRKMQALMAAGYCPTVSSRGYGSLEKDSSGVDIVQEDYVCEGWDVVFTPSFNQAVIHPQDSSTNESKISKGSTARVVESSNTQGGNTPSVKQTNRITMDANQIRSSLQSFASLEASKLTPQKYAEGMRQMEGLHEHAETWCNQDTAARRWETTRLHGEISAIQESWTSAAAAPSAQVVRLSEDKAKLLSVSAKVVETATAIKKKLSEAMDANGQLMAVNQRNLTRGRAWKQFAESTQAKLKTLDEKYDVSTTALEMLAEKFKALKAENDDSVLRLGRRVLELEFADRVKTDKRFATKLREAKTPEDLAQLRESITRTPGAKPVTSTNESKTSGRPETLSESKAPKAPKAEEKSKDSTSDTGNTGTIIVPVGNPRHVSESIAIARRLTAATTGSQQ